MTRMNKISHILVKYSAPACLLALCLMTFSANGPDALAAESKIKLTEIRTAVGISDKYEPVGPTEVFALGTTKIYCWFKWENAAAAEPLQARWTYLTKKIKIFEYPVAIPKPEGAGGIAMAMPKGRSLPPGKYRVDLLDRTKKSVGSIDFAVGA